MHKVLAIGDGVTPTGFARVMHSILGNLPEEEYELHHLAINYLGDPHPYKHRIYPAPQKGNIYGINRLEEFKNKGIGGIFILNDLWIINMYLEELKKIFGTEVPPVIIYFPVDAKDFDIEWFQHFDIVKQAVAYTNFGYSVVKETYPDYPFKVIPHGVSTDVFYPLAETTLEKKKLAYPNKPQFQEDTFIVLNAHRNQPRKRLDISMEGFGLFAENKENVFYYHHAGIQDVGWHILKLAKKFKMDRKVILTNLELSVQKVSDERLNQIYNGCDVGLNTSMGEGWGLPNVEHASTGAVQVVPNHSACAELFEDCGVLIPTTQHLHFERILTKGYLVSPEDVADRLEFLYNNKNIMEDLSTKCYNKFTDPKYSWKEIAKIWDSLFKETFIES